MMPPRRLPPHPESTPDRVVVEIAALGDQPGGLGQDAGPLGAWQSDWLFGNPFPVGRQAIGEVGPQISSAGPDWFFRLGVNAVLDEALVGGEQFTQDVLVLFVEVHDELVGVAHQDLRYVVAVECCVLEDVGRSAVLEVFAEET